jgi:uncharacterized alpha-E superfamily protein
MPGGFCRIAERDDARAISMGEGARSADVWVLSDRPVPKVTLLSSGDDVRIRRISGQLPSRAADNLFWLGRYLERAEATLRLVRSICSSLMETSAASHGAAATVQKHQRLLIAWGAGPRREPSASASRLAAEALQRADQAGSVLCLVRSAQRAASTLRERLSQDTWALITALGKRIEPAGEDASATAGTLEIAEEALRILAGLSGLAQENMSRGSGWRFLDLGRRLERGIDSCRFARQFASDDASGDDLDVLLDLADSQITYRSRYLVGLSLAPVRDLVVLDPFNPRSVAFQVGAIADHLAALPTLKEDGMPEIPRRLALSLTAEIGTEEAGRLTPTRVMVLEQALLALAAAVEERYFPHGPHAARPEKLTGLA